MWAFRVTGILLLCVSSHKYTWTEIWVFYRLRMKFTALTQPDIKKQFTVVSFMFCVL